VGRTTFAGIQTWAKAHSASDSQTERAGSAGQSRRGAAGRLEARSFRLPGRL